MSTNKTNYKRWTSEEVDYLTDNYGTVPTKDITDALDRTLASVQRKAIGLGLKMDSQAYHDATGKTRWTAEEDNELIENYERGAVKVLSERLGRTEGQIRSRAKILGITGGYSKWTEEEENYLINSWGKRSTKVMAKKLGRSEEAVKLKAHKLNLRQQHTAYGEFYTTAELAELLGVGKKTVYYWIDTEIINYTSLKVGSTTRVRFSVEDITEFMEKYTERYDTRKGDWSILKTFFVKTRSGHKEVIVYDELPEWLEEKIAKDKEKDLKVVKQWTTREEQRLIKLIDEGYSVAEVSKQLGRTDDSIRGKLRLMNNR